MAKKKIDPLNKKQYGAVSVMLTVSDISAAVAFYQKAFGFAKRGIMKGPDGKPIHAELALRGTTLMLGPENASMGKRTAKSLGASPASSVSPGGKRRQIILQGRQPRSHSQWLRDGHVLGRSLRQPRGSGRILLDGRNPQSRAHHKGNEKEDAGTDSPTSGRGLIV
jgi:catechol 2,3-dioxygenase-like lactoylglutathione lyase family enzyme